MSKKESIEVYRNTVKIDVNDVRINMDNFVYKDTTYVPLRAIAEALDKEVGWNSYTKVASINDKEYKREELSSLLPPAKGFIWKYEGFAEYSHEMKLNHITDYALQRVYNITGEVGDPSDGESQLDKNLTVKYIISENKLVQEKTESLMLDSKYDKITLIQTPLIAGTFWSETLVDKKGNSAKINAFIKKVEVSSNGSKEYTVRYDDAKSSYYEERVIKEGIGVINFKKLLELKDSSFEVSYFIFEHSKVTKSKVKLYFPDNNAQKLHLEQRNVNVLNGGIARATVEALIEGPTSNLTASIPSGTELLNIYINNKVIYVDFSQEFISNHSGGSSGEIMTLYSIVNTLTEFSTVNSVKILVEGRTGETLGNIILDQPLERREDLIEY